MKSVVPQLRSLLHENDNLRKVYQFAFNFSKEPARKGLDLEVAVPLWKLLLEGRFAHLNDWCTFAQVRLRLATTG